VITEYSSIRGREATVVTDLDAGLHALKARTRREILALVWDRELTAGDIASAFPLTAATISEHLAVLRKAGLVDMTRVGTSRRYRARPEALQGLRGVVEAPGKWRVADDIPETRLATMSTHPAVTASVELPTGAAETFAAFTDPQSFSRWLQVPVTIEGNRFAATMEWGTEVRGLYELVVPPHLIALSWDFDDDNVPVPGRSLSGYLRVFEAPDGCRVEVHQLVDNPEQAIFMEAAWGMVLGRLKTDVLQPPGEPAKPVRRARRPKNRPQSP
jgi:DNA-binding transcriptional ArsR family regulator/uncharacterized protein YndB with AHSA1/START domain